MQLANNYYSNYQNELDKMKISYIIILIVALLLIVIIMSIEIPISMKINRTNNKVLSCFGII